MLKVRIIESTVTPFIRPRHRMTFNVMTNSPEGFRKWCYKNMIIVSFFNDRSSRARDFNTSFQHIRILSIRPEDADFIIKKWGYFDEKYDLLSTYGKFKFKLNKKFGKVLSFHEMVL